jgi:hypothetical protein
LNQNWINTLELSLFIVMRSVDGVAFASADVFSGGAQKTDRMMGWCGVDASGFDAIPSALFYTMHTI